MKVLESLGATPAVVVIGSSDELVAAPVMMAASRSGLPKPGGEQPSQQWHVDGADSCQDLSFLLLCQH